jgi:hypothetical protein
MLLMFRSSNRGLVRPEVEHVPLRPMALTLVFNYCRGRSDALTVFLLYPTSRGAFRRQSHSKTTGVFFQSYLTIELIYTKR